MISKTALNIIDRTDYIDANYVNSPGGFFTYDREKRIAGIIVMCRETLAQSYVGKDTKHIGYSYKTLDLKKMDEFMEEIERKLDKKIKTHLFPTQYKHACVVYIPPFWRRSEVNRSFFSLFVRCGAAYYKTSLNQAFEDYPLCKGIRPAIDWFLAGNTVAEFTSLGNGVCEKFHRITSDKTLKDMLRPPKSPKVKEKESGK